MAFSVTRRSHTVYTVVPYVIVVIIIMSVCYTNESLSPPIKLCAKRQLMLERHIEHNCAKSNCIAMDCDKAQIVLIQLQMHSRHIHKTVI